MARSNRRKKAKQQKRRALAHKKSARVRADGVVLCKLTLNDDGEVPDWIELIPAGKTTARDGRKFNNASPEKVVEAFNSTKLDLPIDFEHATEIKAPKGEEAPAAGWIKELEVRDGVIWARVEWTDRGKIALQSKDYRYISPAFYHDEKGIVLELSSAGLTNTPALDQLAAVAHAAQPNGDEAGKVKTMDPELLAALGLSKDATEEQAIKAAQAFRADAAKFSKELSSVRVELATARSAEPPLDKFVPRADHDAMKLRAESAEKELQSYRAETQQKEIDVEISAALEAGKITPATVEYHKAQCASEGGLERFRAFVEAAPAIAEPSGLDSKSPTESVSALNETQKAICANLGLSEEDYQAALAKKGN